MKMTCAILAGGKSTRMGQDKATIKIGERPLIHIVYDKVKEAFDDIIIISRLHDTIEGINAPVLKDVVPFGNTMTGIVSAMLYSETPYTFVVACDMPLLSTETFKYMVNEATGEDIIIPKTRWGFEPLHAIYNRSCMAHLFRLIEQKRFKITEVLPFVSVKELEEQPCFFRNNTSVFTNINTMKDLSMVEAV
jgi:molybdopterin-guanine dinucleotide biosynthesis protein A